MKRSTILSAVLAVGLATAGPTSAQTRIETSTLMNLSRQIDGDTYTIELRNGEVVGASVNGLDIDTEQVRQTEEGEYQFFDEAGDVLATIPAPMVAIAGDASPFAIAGLRGNVGIVPPMNPPAVVAVPRAVMGIRHGPVDEQLRAFLDLEEDEARVIIDVVKDLPADRAGLRPFDVIVAIDGDGPVTTEFLTNTLADRDAGDTVELTVMRAGKKFEVEVELEPMREAFAIGIAREEGELARRFARPGDLNERFPEGFAERELFNELPEILDRLEGFERRDGFPLLIEREGIEEDVERFYDELDDRLGELEERLDELENRSDERFEDFADRFDERFDRFEEMFERFVEVMERREGRDR